MAGKKGDGRKRSDKKGTGGKGKDRVVFLDRDGTLVVDTHFPHRPEELELEENAAEGLKLLRDAGYELVIVTNQSGIGRGVHSEEDYHTFMKELHRVLGEEGITISEAFYCPHHPGEGCNCRKPGTGMVDDYVEEKDLELEDSWVVGDKTSDVKLAHNLGIRSVLVETGKAGRDGRHDAEPDFVAKDLLEAATFINKG